MEIQELFTLLESNQPQVVEDVKNKFHELFNSCNPNDAWLVNGLFDYAMQTGSMRSVEILVGIREPHDTHLFNKFCESFRTNNKHNSLTLLGHVVRRQPTWLFRIARHNLFKDLLKLLKTETEIIPLMSALLVINILLPMVAGLMEPFIHDLFSAFSHLAVWDSNNPNKLPESQLLHLQMGLYALFLRLYGMYPCNFLYYLRQEYSNPQKLSIFSHTIKPMLDNVKMHPLLVTASKEYEVAPSRWRKMEPHDVVVECARFAISGDSDRAKEERVCRTHFDYEHQLEGKYQSQSASGGRETDFWGPSSFSGLSTPPESAPTSIPHTPIAQVSPQVAPDLKTSSTAEIKIESHHQLSYLVKSPLSELWTHIISSSFPQQEGTSPPEAAVEATPETTPIKDLRHVVRGGPSTSGIPRALNAITSSPSHSQPSSPMRKESSPFNESSAFHQPSLDTRQDSLITQKFHRILTDRVQIAVESADSKNQKSKVSMQPGSPLPFINPGTDSPADMVADQEDREVEITMTTESSSVVWNSRQCDSVVQDIVCTEQEELEECQQESCRVGGICMPNSNSMRDFPQQVKSRLRFYSQCHPDTSYQGLSTGSSPSEGFSIPISSKVRRASSCPEMKKTCSSLERYPVEKLDEEPSPVNGNAVDFPQVTSDNTERISTGTQTDMPLPYEHLFLAVFPTVEQPPNSTSEDISSGAGASSSPLPQRRVSPIQLDTFMGSSTNISDTKKNKMQGIEAELKACKEQLLLLNLQLHFEKYRREMHAERTRRLLGKCRKVRSQEELTAALKDQVALLQTDKELLHSDLHKKLDELQADLKNLQDINSAYLQQNTTLQAEYTKERFQRESLEQQLKQERKKTAIVTKELNEIKATLFTTANELQQTVSMANEGRDLKETIQRLQRELMIGGEVQDRYRQRVTSLLNQVQQSLDISLLQESYSQQIYALNQALETQTTALEASKSRAAELDALLAKRDATLAENKQLLQDAKDEYHEQLQAVESKYNSLRAVNSRLEAELLKLRHEIGASQHVTQRSPALPPPVQGEHYLGLQSLADAPDTAADTDSRLQD